MANRELIELVAKSPLFAMFDEPLLGKLSERFEFVSFQLGETVIRKDDQADALFILYSGKARVVGRADDGSEITLATLARGDSFGERALLTNERRSATVRAASELVIARLAKDAFRSLVEGDERLERYLTDYLAQQALRNFLRQFTVFAALTAKETALWLDQLVQEQIPRGEYVFRQGDSPDKFYVIISGKAEALRDVDGKIERIRILREGEFFGELALLTGKPRVASVRAIEDLVVAALSREKFDRLISQSPKLKEKIANVVALYNLEQAAELDLGPVARVETPPPAVERPRPAEAPQEEEEPYERPYRNVLDRLLKRTVRPLKYPFVRQYDQSDCGAACLAMITKYYGRTVSVTRLRDMANVSTQGASLMSVAMAAESLGFNTRALKTTYETLLTLRLPAIVHWDGYHYIVLYKATPNEVLVGDPARGLLTYERGEFSKRWTGYALALQPTSRLEGIEPAKKSFARFVAYVRPHKALLGEILLTSLLITLFGLATPVFTQIIVDNVVVHQNVTLLNTVLAGMLVVTLFTLSATALRAYLMSHISNKLEMAMLSDFYRQVLSLPMRYFALRRVGDIMARFMENNKIKDLLTGSVVSIFIDVLMIVVYLTVMLLYSYKLALAVLVFIPVFAAITVGFTPAFKRMSRKAFETQAATESHMVESVTGVQTVKAVNAELFNRWKYENLLAKNLATRFEFAMLDLSAGCTAGFFRTLSTVVLLYLGAHLVMRGELTIGQLMAFTGLIGQVIEPVNKLIQQWQRIQEAMIAIERLTDVFDITPEAAGNGVALVEMPRMKGHIKLENVSFAYSSTDPPVLRNVTLEILPGQTAAIVGRSGSGKTTLVNLLLRFYEPTQGRILIDGMDIRHVTIASLRKQIGIVLQENYLFSGTVLDNIALGAPDKPFPSVVEATTLAAAHDFISALPMAYRTEVGERGSTLSGGQRQRIAIARALLPDPRIVVFDEATSALDNESEKAIQKSLATITRDRTTIVIAHRLTTIQNADLIVVLDQGVVVEQGTHHALLDKRGLYYYLSSMSLDLA